MICVLPTILLSILIAGSTWATVNAGNCEGLVSYQLVLNTFWSKELFPKQYPTYRPNAQWSRLIGRSHNSRYSMWKEGSLATEGLKEFAEKGLSVVLDMEPQGNKGIYDAFIGPNIPQGVGSSSVKILVHPAYNKLSFVVRVIPSPDWFIGIDSLDLCTENGWVLEKTIDLHPIDSGTDRGFTFSSPDWPEVPYKVIQVMTSKSPNHPASSFFYPDLPSLPPIAKLQLKKIDLTWVDIPENTTKENDIKVAPTVQPNGEVKLTGKSAASVETQSSEIKQDSSRQNSTESLGKITSIARAVIRKTYSRHNRTKFLRNGRSGSRPRTVIVRTGEGQIDCSVSDWSEWSTCSKTCGFGVRTRTRSVVHRAHNGGHPCPLLREEQMCGSMRSCNWKYFSHMSGGTNETETGVGEAPAPIPAL